MEDALVPEDVRQNPAIQTRWESMRAGHPAKGITIATEWEGTQATIDVSTPGPGPAAPAPIPTPTPAPAPVPSIDVAGVGLPRALDARTHPCRCVAEPDYHNPDPRLIHAHHIVPLAWGGADDDDNIAPLCPSSHENLHAALRAWVRAGRPTRTTLTPYVRDLARQAWEGRSTDPAVASGP